MSLGNGVHEKGLYTISRGCAQTPIRSVFSPTYRGMSTYDYLTQETSHLRHIPERNTRCCWTRRLHPFLILRATVGNDPKKLRPIVFIRRHRLCNQPGETLHSDTPLMRRTHRRGLSHVLEPGRQRLISLWGRKGPHASDHGRSERPRRTVRVVRGVNTASKSPTHSAAPRPAISRLDTW